MDPNHQDHEDFRDLQAMVVGLAALLGTKGIVTVGELEVAMMKAKATRPGLTNQGGVS